MAILLKVQSRLQCPWGTLVALEKVQSCLQCPWGTLVALEKVRQACLCFHYLMGILVVMGWAEEELPFHLGRQ